MPNQLVNGLRTIGNGGAPGYAGNVYICSKPDVKIEEQNEEDEACRIIANKYGLSLQSQHRDKENPSEECCLGHYHLW